MSKEDKTVSTSTVNQTSDYSIFKKMDGNREEDPKKVSRIKNSMLEHGNLTAEFPIVVNEHMEIVDGQHRLAVTKELGWPIGWHMQEGLTLETVRGINSAGSNWSWKDIMHSYTKKGTPEQKDNYTKFLTLYKEFGFSYSVMRLFTIGMRKKTDHIKRILQGELVIPNYDSAHNRLTMLSDIVGLVGQKDSHLCQSVYMVINNPEYNHLRMTNKLKTYDKDIRRMATVGDYTRLLEDIYNWHIPADNRTRFY